MRRRLPVRRSLFVAAFFALALVALLPLRLALDLFAFERGGLAARAATGSVWNGALQEARIGPVALGDVGARLHLLPLFLGRARLAIEGTDPQAPLRGAATVTRGGVGFDDVTGAFRLGAPAAPLPIASLELRDLSAGFENGRCARAGGRVLATAAGEFAGLAARLGGNVRCDGEALLLPLASPSGMERLELRLFADGRYRADLIVRSGDGAVRTRLAAAGFRPAGNALAIRVDGAF